MHEDYRDGRIIKLLWRGLATFIVRNKVDVIFHAAAYKHVPIVEYHENISEGLKNNIFGTKVLCQVAADCNVKKVVVISTDKAVAI